MPLWEQLGLLLLLSAVLVAVLVWIPTRRRRRDPQERERRRRLAVNQTGRPGEAIVIEVQDGTVYYSYTVRGVSYNAAQDFSSLKEFVPEDPERMIGPARLKYAINNPANSILFCEEWSGVEPVVRVSR